MSKLSFLKKKNDTVTIQFANVETNQTLNTIHNYGILLVPILTFFWLYIYVWIREKLPNKGPKFCIRILIIIHGLFASYIGLNACINKGLYDNHLPQTNYQGLILASSGSFFIINTIWHLINETKSVLFTLYNICNFLIYLRAFQQGYSGQECVCMLGTMQSTTPLFSTLWILRSFKYENTTTYTIASLLYCLSYICLRTSLSTILFLVAIFSKKAYVEYKIMTFIFFVITCYYMKYVYRMYKKLQLHRS